MSWPAKPSWVQSCAPAVARPLADPYNTCTAPTSVIVAESWEGMPIARSAWPSPLKSPAASANPKRSPVAPPTSSTLPAAVRPVGEPIVLLPSLSGQQAMAGGVGRRLRPVGGAGLGENVADVAQHCVVADDQPLRDLAVAAAGGDQPQDVHFAPSQAAGIGGARASVLLTDLLRQPAHAQGLGGPQRLGEQPVGVLPIRGGAARQQ